MIRGRVIQANYDNYCFNKLTFFEDPFLLQSDKYFAKFRTRKDMTYGWMDADYLYAPIFKIQKWAYEGLVYNLEVDEDNSYVSEFATVHNCWTPWFSVFGSRSGFDSLQECFQDRAKYIHAVETGMSSDPMMNWRISALDNTQLVSFSDAHSYWPWRLGREATVFDGPLRYSTFLRAVRTGEGLVETLEVQPHYGKYHFDGHRACNVVLPPAETKKLNGICPVCKRPLTIGVQHRVDELADRPEGYIPKNAKPFKSSIPLSEMITMVLQSGIATKKVWEMYNSLIKSFGTEFAVLFDADVNKIGQLSHPMIAEIINLSREGKLDLEAGYDGVYGKLKIGGHVLQPKDDEPVKKPVAQKTLGEY